MVVVLESSCQIYFDSHYICKTRKLNKIMNEKNWGIKILEKKVERTKF